MNFSVNSVFGNITELLSKPLSIMNKFFPIMNLSYYGMRYLHANEIILHNSTEYT
jgi:hypothetical protein